MKVSVLIPCYNSAKYLGESVNSVLNQSWKDIEIVIVDDGSTDNSFEIAKSYESQNVVVVRQKNYGACRARNFAFELCSGDYIQYLDSDDILSFEKIEAQMKLLNGRKDIISCSKWVKFQRDVGEASLNNLPVYKDYDIPAEILSDMWNGRAMMQTSSWLVPREIIKKAGPWNEALTINQDGEFFCRVVLFSKQILYSDIGVVYYRTGLKSNVSFSKGSRIKAISLLESYSLYVDHLRAYLNNEAMRNGLAANFYSFIYIYYHEYPDLVKRAMEVVKELDISPPLGNIGGKAFERFLPILGFYNILKIRKFKHYLFSKLINVEKS